MSRGPGKWQRTILRALRGRGPFPLRGTTASETAALVRAARKLEASGVCVIVVRPGKEGGRLVSYAAPPTAAGGEGK